MDCGYDSIPEKPLLKFFTQKSEEPDVFAPWKEKPQYKEDGYKCNRQNWGAQIVDEVPVAEPEWVQIFRQGLGRLHYQIIVIEITPRNHIHRLYLKEDVEEPRGDCGWLGIECNHEHNNLLGVDHTPKLLECYSQ